MSSEKTLSWIGNYQVIDVVDKGSQAKIYKVKHPETGNIYAAKILKSGIKKEDLGLSRAHLRNEDYIFGKLFDEGINDATTAVRDRNRLQSTEASKYFLRIEEWTEHGGRLYVIMPYVEENLLRWLPPTDKTLVDRLRIAADITMGVRYLHEKKFVHRDLKPENIFIRDDTACIADFGITLQYKTPMGAQGAILYMPPELLVSKWHDGAPVITRDSFEQQVHPSHDIYSLGIIFWELFLGGHPFEDNIDLTNIDLTQPGARMQAILTNMRDPAYYKALPDRLEQIVNEKEPELPERVKKTIIECLHPKAGKRPSIRTVGSRIALAYNKFAAPAETSGRKTTWAITRMLTDAVGKVTGLFSSVPPQPEEELGADEEMAADPGPMEPPQES